jgi:hypothetical protein
MPIIRLIFSKLKKKNFAKNMNNSSIQSSLIY